MARKSNSKSLDKAKIEHLIDLVDHHQGGSFDLFQEEVKTVGKMRVTDHKKGGFTISLEGVRGKSLADGTAGKWQAMRNWCSAARRALIQAA